MRYIIADSEPVQSVKRQQWAPWAFLDGKARDVMRDLRSTRERTPVSTMYHARHEGSRDEKNSGGGRPTKKRTIEPLISLELLQLRFFRECCKSRICYWWSCARVQSSTKRKTFPCSHQKAATAIISKKYCLSVHVPSGISNMLQTIRNYITILMIF